MSADLHIRILKDVTENDVREFDEPFIMTADNGGAEDRRNELYSKIGNTPCVWIGEVSWLKAMLFEDSETFIPDTVQKISDLIGDDFPVLDENLLNQIEGAFDLPNKTVKKDGVWSSNGYSIAKKKDVIEFLKQYIGYKLFTVSW